MALTLALKLKSESSSFTSLCLLSIMDDQHFSLNMK